MIVILAHNPGRVKLNELVKYQGQRSYTKLSFRYSTHTQLDYSTGTTKVVDNK